MLGITFEVTYSTGSGVDHYTYTYIVDGDATIAVTIGTASQPKAYKKINGVWTESATVYTKQNGVWTAQSDPSAVFDNTKNYLQG